MEEQGRRAMTDDKRCLPGVRSRRRLLARALAGGLAMMMAGLLASCASLGPPAPRIRNASDDAALLDNLLGLENEAVAAYELVCARGVLKGAERAQAAAFEEDHRKHAEALARMIDRLGGKKIGEAKRDYGFSPGAVAEREDAIGFLIDIEQGVAFAQLAAVPAFATRPLAKDAAAMLGAEAMHWAYWRQALGKDPVPAPFLTQ
jgi:hypothetical protein